MQQGSYPIGSRVINLNTDNATGVVTGATCDIPLNALAVAIQQYLGLTLPIAIASGGTGATTAAQARTNLGLGSIATQNSNSVAVTGGTVDGTIIGGTTPAAGTFSTLSATTPIAVSSGGTGANTLTNHGVLIGQGASAVTATGAGVSGQALISGGPSANPAFGTLGVSGGGTGATSAGATAANNIGALAIANNLSDLANATTATSNLNYLQGGAGSVARSLTNKFQETISVKDFGAVGNGVTDDTSAIQSAINACPSYGTVFFPPGTYLVSSTITISAFYIRLLGPAKWLAKASTNFDYMLSATSMTGIVVEMLEFDANKVNRSSGQNIRFMGAGLISCTDSYFKYCTARNTRGYSNVTAVGLVIGGTSVRCGVFNCYVENCGDAAPNPSDGIYTSGTQTIISNSIAVNCTDTGFVIESSNQSVITGCTAVNCSAGAAITNAISTDCYGNIIDGLTVENWNSSVTGGIQLGVPTATTGNLYDTSVSNVVIHANTGGGFGTGPAINVRTNGSGKAIDMSLSNIRIDGATTQGILIDGSEVSVVGCVVKNTSAACIQINSGTNHFISNNQLIGGTFSVYAANAASLVAQLNYCQGPSGFGVYADNTSTVRSIFNTILSPGTNYEGKAGGATLKLIGHRDGFPAFNQTTGSAPTGGLVNKISAYDNTGTPIGVIPIYSA